MNETHSSACLSLCNLNPKFNICNAYKFNWLVGILQGKYSSYTSLCIFNDINGICAEEMFFNFLETVPQKIFPDILTNEIERMHFDVVLYMKRPPCGKCADKMKKKRNLYNTLTILTATVYNFQGHTKVSDGITALRSLDYIKVGPMSLDEYEYFTFGRTDHKLPKLHHFYPRLEFEKNNLDILPRVVSLILLPTPGVTAENDEIREKYYEDEEQLPLYSTDDHFTNNHISACSAINSSLSSRKAGGTTWVICIIKKEYSSYISLCIMNEFNDSIHAEKKFFEYWEKEPQAIFPGLPMNEIDRKAFDLIWYISRSPCDASGWIDLIGGKKKFYKSLTIRTASVYEHKSDTGNEAYLRIMKLRSLSDVKVEPMSFDEVYYFTKGRVGHELFVLKIDPWKSFIDNNLIIPPRSVSLIYLPSISDHFDMREKDEPLWEGFIPQKETYNFPFQENFINGSQLHSHRYPPRVDNSRFPRGGQSVERYPQSIVWRGEVSGENRGSFERN